MKYFLILLLAICSFYGCASPFNIKNGILYSPKVDISFDMPQRGIWALVDMTASEKAQAGIMIVTNIPRVFIMIEKFPYDQERMRQMENLSNDRLTSEEAGLAKGTTIISHDPTQIDGKPGYKLIYTFKSQGRIYEHLNYRFHHKNWFYSLLFVAPKHQDFAEQISYFEMVKETFKFGVNPYIKNEIR